MSEPEENENDSGGAEPEELESAGQWRNVPQPSAEDLVSPGAGRETAPQMPMAVKVGGLALVAVLLLLSAWLGLTLGGAGGSGLTPASSPSIDDTLWPLEPPTTVGDFVVGDVTNTPVDSSNDREIVRATYADGSDKLILILSRPEDDLDAVLANANVENTESVEGSTCGISVDTLTPVCARVVDDTAIAVVGISEQNFTTLAPLVDSFHEELR